MLRRKRFERLASDAELVLALHRIGRIELTHAHALGGAVM